MSDAVASCPAYIREVVSLRAQIASGQMCAGNRCELSQYPPDQKSATDQGQTWGIAHERRLAPLYSGSWYNGYMCYEEHP